MQGSLHISYLLLKVEIFESTKKDPKLFTDHSIKYKLPNDRTHGRNCASVARAWSRPAQNTKTNRSSSEVVLFISAKYSNNCLLSHLRGKN